MKLYLVTRGEHGSSHIRIYAFLWLSRAMQHAAWMREQADDDPREWTVTEKSDTSELIVWETPRYWVSIAPIGVDWRKWDLLHQLQCVWFGWRNTVRSYIHVQNLNEKKDGSHGSILKHGRAWLRRPSSKDDPHKRRRTYRLCWVLWTHFVGATVEFGEGDSGRAVQLYFACGLFAVWFEIDPGMSHALRDRLQFGNKDTAQVVDAVYQAYYNRPKSSDGLWCLSATNTAVLDYLITTDPQKRTRVDFGRHIARAIAGGFIQRRNGDTELAPNFDKCTGYWPRRIGVRWFDGTLWLSCWENSECSSARDPWWQRITFTPLDFLFGMPRHSAETLFLTYRTIAIGSERHQVQAELKLETWTRPRWPFWPFERSVRRAHMKCEAGIPIPGKGENSWDQDEDASYGLTCVATSVDDGIEQWIDTIQKTRKRYGGENWKPSQKARA